MSSLTIPLTVSRHPLDRARSRRVGEPVTFGVPLPEGACLETAWRLIDDRDELLPIQTRVLDRWSDGSIRWLLIDSQVDVSAGSSASLRLCSGGASVPGPTLRLTRTNGGVRVDTGSASFVLAAGSSFPFSSATADTGTLLDPSGGSLELIDASGHSTRATVTAIDVISEGPLHGRIDLVLSTEGTLKDLALRASLDFFAGLSAVHLSLRVRNPNAAAHQGGFWDLGDAGSILIKDLSFVLRAGASGTTASASVELGDAPAAVQLPFELYQDSSGGDNWDSSNHMNRKRRVPHRFRGYRVRSGHDERFGLRATPIVAAPWNAGAVAVAVPHFWQNCPRALEAAPGELRLRFFPEQYDDLHELQGGEQKTHRCVVSFGADRVTDSPLEWCCTPLHVRAQPGWYGAALATAWIAPDDPGRAALVHVAVEGPDSFEQKREIIDEYGWRHFGDIYGDHEAVRHAGPSPLVSHYNNQYDPVAGFLYQYFRSGDVRWWHMADELAAHVIDIDVYHTTQDKWAYNNGLFWHTCHYCDADTSTHRTYPASARGVVHGGGPSPDHTYTTGLMLHHFLTGSEDSRETVIGLGQFIIDADDGSKTILRWLTRAPTGYATASGSYTYHGPGRGPGNSLNSLLDAHRLTSDGRFLTKADVIIRRVAHPDEDVTKNRLDDPEHRWFYLMFLQSLGKYLGYKVERREIDQMYAYGQAVLLRYADWMASHEQPFLDQPDKLEYPTETWAAHEVRKSDVLCMAALCASGTTRDRYLERGAFFFQTAVDTLAQMPTRTLARPVIILLSSGLVLPALRSGTLPSWPLMAPHKERQGTLHPFRSQKEIAKGRIKAILVGLGVLGLAAVALSLRIIFAR